MPHITLPTSAPGIVGPMLAYPQTEKHLSALAQTLLRGTSSLSPGEREIIAAAVSSANGCVFCAKVHAAVARHLLGSKTVVSDRLRALLVIAEKVRRNGREVAAEDIERARQQGADDRAIHDTVLIAAAFCMLNRYVDGLAAWTPDDPAVYEQIGERLARDGYCPAYREAPQTSG